MHVIYFGTYRKQYGRNRVIIDGLRQNGVEVTECHERLWQGMEDREQLVRGGWINPSFWLRVMRAYWLLLMKYRKVGPHDILMVGYPGYFDIFLARLLAWVRRKPLVWDVLNSLFLMASERGISRQHKSTARLIQFLETAAARLPDLMFLDTEAFVRWFCELHGLRTDRFRVVPVGADTGVFQKAANGMAAVPQEVDAPFRVLYYGTFIPNHGVDVIVEAARRLSQEPQIQFELVGAGPDQKKARSLAQEYGLSNIRFIDWLEKHELAARVASCNICLGSFGDTLQASLTNNNKIYEAFALNKPVISGRSPAMPDTLHHNEHLYLVDRGNSQALADAILTLRAKPDLAQRLGENGSQVLTTTYNEASIGALVKNYLQELLDRGGKKQG